MKPTAQYLFDRIARHLLAQRCQSRDGGDCAYRGADNTKCAVGAIMPDAAYWPGVEGLPVRGLYRCKPPIEQAAAFNVWINDVVLPNLELLSDLQRLHDQCPIALWAPRLAETAKAHGLNASVIEEVALA